METEIATKLEFEDLETVTFEDIALEVKSWSLFGYHFDLWLKMLKVNEQCSSDSERNREVDKSEENDGRSFSTFLGRFYTLTPCISSRH